MIHLQAPGARNRRRAAPVLLALALALGAQEAPPEDLPPAEPEAATAPAPEVEPPAAVTRFAVDRATVQLGEWVEFHWETRNAAWVVLEPLGIRLLSTGSLIHRPPASATYWLSAVNGHGGQSWPLAVVVQPAEGPFPVPAPALPPSPAPAVPPGLAPAVPAPVAQQPAPPGPSGPLPVVPVPAGTPEPPVRGYWVQFGALASRVAAQILLDRLDRTLAEPISIEVAGPAAGAGRTVYRVHTGPYPTRTLALAKLREARRRIPARLAKPLVVQGSPPVPDGTAGAAPAAAGRRRSRRG